MQRDRDATLRFERDYDRFPGVHAPDTCAASRAPSRTTSLIHTDEQDRHGEAWRALLDLIDRAAREGWEAFAPAHHLPPKLWAQIVILPDAIGSLAAVEHLILYGSNLVAIPPEIGQMSALETFDPYTSDRLHWFPYEITRCPSLIESRASTRLLYGNNKTRAPFPALPATLASGASPKTCSVCEGEFSDSGPLQRWLSLAVATDVLPLLVHACSIECIEALPTPPDGYVDHPHTGGPQVLQPESTWLRRRG